MIMNVGIKKKARKCIEKQKTKTKQKQTHPKNTYTQTNN